MAQVQTVSAKTVKRRMTWADVLPFPDNPIYPRRLDSMRREWGGYDNGIVGSPAVCDNAGGAFPDLPQNALIVVDGNHRRALAEQDKLLEAEFLADLHRGLSRAQVHRLRRGLNDRRTVKPAERFIELVAEGDLRRGAIVEAVESAGWRITHDREPGGLPCTNELEWIWQRDHGAMTRTIESYEAIWGRGDARAQARVIKGLGAFWLRYPQADMDRLVTTARRWAGSVDEVYRAGRNQANEVSYLSSVYDGVRHVLAGVYNKGHRRDNLPLA